MKTLPLRFPIAGLVVFASALLPFGCDSASPSASDGNAGTGGTPIQPGDNDKPGNTGGDGGRGGASNDVPDGVPPCVSDKDCTSSGRVCDFERHLCAECLEDSDCGDGVCELGVCASVTTCVNSLDCGNDEVCGDGVCVGCVTEADCSGGQTCHDNQCLDACSSDKDCTSKGMLCDGTQGVCVECITKADCGNGKTCVAGSCKPSACTAGTARCVSSGAVICRSDELGYMAPVDCDDCSFEGGEVYCGDEPLDGTGSNPSLIPGGTFSSGPGNWRLSGAAEDPVPTIKNGAVCESLNSFTLGWPADGDGIEVPAGNYRLSVDLDVEDNDENLYGQVEVKLAGAEAPYEPLLFSETLTELAGISKTYTFDFVVENDAENIGMAINVSNLPGGLCIDNIRLTVR